MQNMGGTCRCLTWALKQLLVQVLAAFDIPYPVSALELNMEPFVFDQFYKPLPTHMQKPTAPSCR